MPIIIRTCLIPFLLLLTTSEINQVAAQSASAAASPAKQKDSFNVLLINGGSAVIDPRPFRRMTNTMYGYTLSGSNNPVSGVKVTTTSPSVSYTGNCFLNPINILTYEVAAQTQDNVAQLFSNKKLNGGIKVAVGYNYLLPYNSGTYDRRQIALIKKRQNAFRSEKQAVYLTLDTAVILKHLLTDTLDEKYTFDTLINKVTAEIFDLSTRARIYDLRVNRDKKFYLNPKNEASKTDPSYVDIQAISKQFSKAMKEVNETVASLARKAQIIEAVKNLAARLMNSFLKAPATSDPLPENWIFDKYKTELGSTYAKKVDELYQKVSGILELNRRGVPMTLVSRLDDSEINLTDQFWLKKAIGWMNVSVGYTNNSYTMYDTMLTPISKKLFDTTVGQLALTVSYNHLTKYKSPNAFFYYTLGAGITGVNTIGDVGISKFNYSNNTFVDSAAGAQILSTKSGQAYKGNLKKGFGYKLAGEFYIKPWKSKVVPGIYTRLEFDHGDVWTNQNVLTASLGAVINISNADKPDSKNLVTIIPYINLSNIAKTYKDVDKTKTLAFNEKLMFGIKVGVPIYY